MVGGNMFDMRPMIAIVLVIGVLLGVGLDRCSCGYSVRIESTTKDGGR